jgi:hypothetical protein
MVRKALSIFMVMLFLVVAACANSQEINIDTPEKKYLAARMEFNKTIKSFLAHKTLLPLEQQQVFSDKYRVYFQEVDKALDAWSLIVVGGEDGNVFEAEAAFLTAKQSLLNLLIAEGIIKIE